MFAIIIAFGIQIMLGWLAEQGTQTNNRAPDITLPPFPLGVNPEMKTITERPELDEYVAKFLASNHTAPRRAHSFTMLLRRQLEQFTWYQQLATPSRRVAVIWSGDRHEQVTHHFRTLFGWDAEEAAKFQIIIQNNIPDLEEGMFFPGRYVFNLPATPEKAAFTVNQRFLSEVQLRYTPEIEAIVSLADTLTIASLIEREAYDFEDMRIISGVIWNRLFIDMPLQLDATLQYVRGQPGSNRAWWPVPRPADKFIDSPYNTYQITGLPPGPIASPSLDAIIAALNPKATNCLFYFHTNDGSFYCTETYEEHTTLLKEKFSR